MYMTGEKIEAALRAALGEPTFKQALFLSSEARYVAYGGARGGGKSHAVRTKATYLGFEHPGIRMLLVRRTFPELRENHTSRLLDAYERLPASIRPRYSDSDKVFLFPGGARLKLGYCDSEDDVRQYQGQEYDVLFIDEATQLSETQFRWLNACVRGAGPYPKRTYLTCNPGGVGHAWVKRLFIDRDYRLGEDPADYAFIRARVWDNAPLFAGDAGYLKAMKALKKQDISEKERVRRAMDSADYVKQLKSLSPELRRAWLDGDWDVFSGQFFTEFSRDVHVCEPFEIPRGWRCSAALDYGLDMLAVLWFAVSPDGRAYCYRSLEKRDMTVAMAAKAILSAGPEEVCEYIAPPDLWNRRQDTGLSAAEIFADHGVPLVKAGNRRIDGWLAVKEYLRADDGEPRLKIFSTCTPLLRALPLLQHDPKKPGDAATKPHDITHSPDALRYWCSRRQEVPLPVRGEVREAFAPRKLRGDLEDYLMGGYGGM
jgi:phage terminase large subunit